MPYIFPKHPNDMNPQELFDMVQQIQAMAKARGQHSPMYTTARLREGEKPTVKDMHEEATRQQLTALYKNQQKPTPSPNAPQGEQMAMAGAPKAGARVTGTARDGAKLYSDAKKLQNSKLYGFGYEAGEQKAREDYVRRMYGDNPEVWLGYADGLEAAKKRDEARNK